LSGPHYAYKKVEDERMDERNDLSPEEEQTTDLCDISRYFGTASQLIERYTHCAICGSNLHFTHVTDFGKNLTFETARCPECGIRARKMMHRLQ
jgi:hypothetical protein